MIKYRDNTTIYLPEMNDSIFTQVKSYLTYQDKSIEYQIKRLNQNKHKWRMDPQKVKIKMDELKMLLSKSMLWSDEKGYYTLSGLGYELSKKFNWEIERLPEEERKYIPVRFSPPEMRSYQKDALEAMLKTNHASIEIPTGGGKSLIITNILMKNPVKTLIIAPLSDIADQLYSSLLRVFGPQYVTKYSSTKTRKSSLFTIATAQALTRVDSKHNAWDELSSSEQIIFDESHTCPAETFKAVCLDGVGKNARYRYFVSATQMRADGSDMLLRGIIGPTVYRLDVKDLVSQGFLKEISVTFLTVPAAFGVSSDPNTETRRNLYENAKVCETVATMCKKIYEQTDLQVVILIEEYNQFCLLKNYLGVPFEFAHGTVSQDAKKTLPEEYWKSDNAAIVDRFNQGKSRILIGTSAISTGVDIQPTGVLFYLQGGKSEIQLKQGIGRGTRPVGPKQLKVFDFIVAGSPTLERHAKYRNEIYETITDLPIKVY